MVLHKALNSVSKITGEDKAVNNNIGVYLVMFLLEEDKKKKRELIKMNMNNKNENILVSIPVVVYTDIELQTKTIIDDNKNKSGIYKWVNTQNGEFYIGSSVKLSRRLFYYLNSKYMTKYKSKSIIYP